MPRPIYPQEKNSRCLLKRRLIKPHAKSGKFLGKTKKNVFSIHLTILCPKFDPITLLPVTDFLELKAKWGDGTINDYCALEIQFALQKEEPEHRTATCAYPKGAEIDVLVNTTRTRVQQPVTWRYLFNSDSEAINIFKLACDVTCLIFVSVLLNRFSKGLTSWITKISSSSRFSTSFRMITRKILYRINGIC